MRPPALDRLGIPGVAGAGLMLFCLAFYLGSIAPAQSELAGLQEKAAQLRAASGGGTERASGADAASAAPLPPISALPDLLKALDSLAEKHGVMIDRASYAMTEKNEQQSGPLRMEITLPLKASYPSLRAYLRDALLLKESSSLDELTLKRQQASDPQVEANVRLSYLFAPSP